MIISQTNSIRSDSSSNHHRHRQHRHHVSSNNDERLLHSNGKKIFQPTIDGQFIDNKDGLNQWPE